MGVKRAAAPLERDDVLQVPYACYAEIRITAGFKPSVETSSPLPFIQSVVSPSESLHPVVKKRNRRRVDNTPRCQFSKQEGVSEYHLSELLPCQLLFLSVVIGIVEIIPVRNKTDCILFRMEFRFFMETYRSILQLEKIAPPNLYGNRYIESHGKNHNHLNRDGSATALRRAGTGATRHSMQF